MKLKYLFRNKVYYTDFKNIKKKKEKNIPSIHIFEKLTQNENSKHESKVNL